MTDIDPEGSQGKVRFKSNYTELRQIADMRPHMPIGPGLVQVQLHRITVNDGYTSRWVRMARFAAG